MQMAFTLGRCSAMTLALTNLMNINEHGVDILRLPQTALKDILRIIVVGDTNSHCVTERTLTAVHYKNLTRADGDLDTNRGKTCDTRSW